MAVQKSKKSKSRRGHRNSANSKAIAGQFITDSETGETVKSHRISPSGEYKGKNYFVKEDNDSDETVADSEAS